MSDLPYSFSQRLLHRFVLGTAVSEMSLDMELSRFSGDADAVGKGRHVFVAGLARAGTTILMRRFHATGMYGSLTYRDMPFVLMPKTWKSLSRFSSRTMEKRERAHGDGVMVDYDSPEAFEDVFWRVTDGRAYIRKDCLVPHQPSGGLEDKFKKYVGVVLESRPSARSRYLSKSNNNIVRLPFLCRAFPESLCIVPFRNPLQHAASLLGQHRRFGAEASAEPFVGQYMQWLVHHEFGPGHRPFRFSQEQNPFSPDDLNYWLFLWRHVYSWLAENTPDRVVFVGYEDLCTETDRVWGALARRAAIDPGVETYEELKLRQPPVREPYDDALLLSCREVYDVLARHSKGLG